MAKIQLNGRKITIKTGSSISEILKKYKLDSSKIAIEHNGKIIQKSNYSKKFLKKNDVLEIVHFIGGG